MRLSSKVFAVGTTLIALFAAPAHAGLTVLHTFCGSGFSCNPIGGGAVPGPLVQDANGNVYGVTAQEGNSAAFENGNVYAILKSQSGYVYNELYAFCPDSVSPCLGKHPVGKLIIDTNGNLYGVTQDGGTDDGGIIFRLSPPAGGTGPWIPTTLYNFCGASCGTAARPNGGLAYVGAASGNAYDGASPLWGTTAGDETQTQGTVYQLNNPNQGPSFATIHTFCTQLNCADGFFPHEVILDFSGNIYGAAGRGGQQGCLIDNESDSCGLIYSLTPVGDGTFSYTILHSFCPQGGGGCTDAYDPRGPLAFDLGGDLLGTGAGGNDCLATTCGTIFKIVPAGKNSAESVVFDFCPHQNPHQYCNVGNGPKEGVWLAAGTCYGSAQHGGANGDYGVLYKISNCGTANPAYAVLYSFCACGTPKDGYKPNNGVVLDPQGNIFATTVGAPGTVVEFSQ